MIALCLGSYKLFPALQLSSDFLVAWSGVFWEELKATSKLLSSSHIILQDRKQKSNDPQINENLNVHCNSLIIIIIDYFGVHLMHLQVLVICGKAGRRPKALDRCELAAVLHVQGRPNPRARPLHWVLARTDSAGQRQICEDPLGEHDQLSVSQLSPLQHQSGGLALGTLRLCQHHALPQQCKYASIINNYLTIA